MTVANSSACRQPIAGWRILREKRTGKIFWVTAHRLFRLGPPTVRVWDDYGPVGAGASLAHYVLAENGNEYIIKGPSLTPAHRYVAANELLAARIGGALGLPVLDHCVVEHGGRFFFGSSWMQKPTFYTNTTPDLFKRCSNRHRAYEIVVFDILLCNVDRHSGNLLVRRTKAGEHLLLMNDHSHCLVLPGEDAPVLTGRLGSPASQYVHLPFVREEIRDVALLRDSIQLLTGLADEDMIALTEEMPDEFLSRSDRSTYSDFLCQRSASLLNIIGAELSLFPNLNGSSL